MGLFSKSKDDGREYRGGCAAHDMTGPARSNPKQASKDTYEHGERMHGSKTYRGAYIERRK